ncbi:MAG TPA: type II toxin-antitoxin system VapC family toxin [Rhodospirillales bacterium]
MILPDVNVLVYAHREDADDHVSIRAWLEGVINSELVYGISDVVLSGFIRVVTHPKVFRQPSSIEDALDFSAQLLGPVNAVMVRPGPMHWSIFTRLCRQARVKGNLVADAYLAALAIESGCEWITTDRDYNRFEGLRWRHPLA